MAWIKVYQWGPEHYTQRMIDEYGVMGATTSPGYIYLHGFDDLYLAEQNVLLAQMGIAYGVRMPYAFDWVPPPPQKYDNQNTVATNNSFNWVYRENNSTYITDGKTEVGYHPITGGMLLPQAYGKFYETKIALSQPIKTQIPKAEIAKPIELGPNQFGVTAVEQVRFLAGELKLYSTGECFAEMAESRPDTGTNRWHSPLNARWDTTTPAVATVEPTLRTAELLLSKYQVPVPKNAVIVGIRVRVYGGRKI